MQLHSDYPYWMISEGILRSFPKLQQNIRTDVLVIGAGITGALVANRLSEAGLQVAVADKRHIGHGSTSASTAMLQYEIDVPLFQLIKSKGESTAVRAYRLCSEAIDRLEELAADAPRNAGYERHPSLYFASYDKHVDEIIKPEYEARRKHGFDVELLQAEEIERRFGFRAPAAILSKQGAQINPYLMCHHLFDKVQERGNPVYAQTHVSDWEESDSGMLARTTEGWEIDAKYIVVACGYESSNYLPKDVQVVDLNSSYALISLPYEKMPFWEKNALIWETKMPYLYMRTSADNRIILGGRDEPFHDAERRDASIGEKQFRLEQDFKMLYPDIPFTTDFAWAGTFGETEDGLPFIGPYDNDRVHFALGYGGNGITFSLIAADIICEAVQGKKHADAGLFSFDRLKDQ